MKAFSRNVDLFHIFLRVPLIFSQPPTGLAVVSLLSFVDRGHLEIGFWLEMKNAKLQSTLSPPFLETILQRLTNNS